MMTTRQDRSGLADVLVTPRLAVWFALPLREPSLPGEDILALGLLGGSMSADFARLAIAEADLPFALPEAAKRAAGDDEEDVDDEDEVDDEEEDDLDEDEDEDDDLDDDDDEDEDDEDEDEEEDDDFLDDDEDDDYDDDEDEFAADDE